MQGVLSAIVLSIIPIIRPFQWQSLFLPVGWTWSRLPSATIRVFLLLVLLNVFSFILVFFVQRFPWCRFFQERWKISLMLLFLLLWVSLFLFSQFSVILDLFCISSNCWTRLTCWQCQLSTQICLINQVNRNSHVRWDASTIFKVFCSFYYS